MTTRNVRFMKILPCVAILAIGGTAAAQNNHPGFLCSALSGTVVADSNGHIQNSSSAPATVMCPVIVDASISGEDPNGTPRTFVTDQNVDANVCCSSRVKNTGQSVISGGSLCSAGNGSGSQSLSLTNPSTTGGNFTFTHRWIQCDLPPIFSGQASEIRTYRY